MERLGPIVLCNIAYCPVGTSHISPPIYWWEQIPFELFSHVGTAEPLLGFKISVVPTVLYNFDNIYTHQ